MVMKTFCASLNRESLEESGIEGLILASPRPFDLVHPDGIPAKGGEPAHLHYDVRYVLIAPENVSLRRVPKASNYAGLLPMKWRLSP